ncbi:hypothetical protein GCM10009799_23510 [Nocardiopsis rhodophaea]|uniref:Uncharacterized protein n=1 Tax=Nocardiopsis rhodophaea TaxID=280238 RepID=A0ABN2T2G4_9ACTN
MGREPRHQNRSLPLRISASNDLVAKPPEMQAEAARSAAPLRNRVRGPQVARHRKATEEASMACRRRRFP